MLVLSLPIIRFKLKSDVFRSLLFFNQYFVSYVKIKTDVCVSIRIKTKAKLWAWHTCELLVELIRTYTSSFKLSINPILQSSCYWCSPQSEKKNTFLFEKASYAFFVIDDRTNGALPYFRY